MDNVDFTIVDGILTEYNGSGCDVVVPDGVWKIDRLAFNSRTITSITLPASLRVIGGHAFSNCIDLTEIVFPDGLESVECYAFSGCSRLKSVVLPKKVTSLGEGAFMKCASLSSAYLPSSISTIGFAMFADCHNLEEIVIPSTVKSIERAAFEGCKCLRRVELPDGLKTIEIDAFAGCENLTEIFIPDSVTVIEIHAFKGCRRLSKVHLPANLSSLGVRAFEMCESLGDCLADENGMLCVGSLLYQYFGNSSVVSIPEGIQTIGAYSFCFNQSLKAVIFPDSVETIGDVAFAHCSSLEFAELPNGVKTIGTMAFFHCENLKKIIIPESVCSIGGRFIEGAPCEVYLHHWFPQCTERLSGSWINHIHIEDLSSAPSKFKLSFALNFIRENNKDLSSPRAKSHLKYLAANSEKLVEPAFDHKELLAFLCENQLIKAKDIDLYIGKALAWNDSEAHTLLLDYKARIDEKELKKALKAKNKSQKEVADRAEKRDADIGLRDLTFVFAGRLDTTSRDAVWRSRSDLDEYLEHYGAQTARQVSNKTDYYVILDYDETGPGKIKAEALGIKVINEEAFNQLVGKRFPDLEHVIVPDWMDHIPAEAFNNVNALAPRKLKSVVLPDSIQSIGHGAFWHCEHLEEITIPESVTEIEGVAFCGCKELKRVSLPNQLRKIGYRAFWGCTKLSEISVPEATEIGEEAFGDCELLTDKNGFVIINGTLVYCSGWNKTVAIPEGVKSIGNRVFMEESWPRKYTEPLEEISFSFGLESIGEYSFSSCNGLTVVTLPKGLEMIRQFAFAYCRELKRIWIPETVKEIGKDAFARCHKMRIYAPEGSYAEQYAKEAGIKFTKCDRESFLEKYAIA